MSGRSTDGLSGGPTCVGSVWKGANAVRPDVLLFIIPLVLILLLTMQGRRRRRDLMNAQQRLAPGAVVMTGAGMFGTVVAIDGDQITLETGPGQTSRWLRQAVVRVITPAPTADADGSSDVHGAIQDATDDPQPAGPADTPVGGAGEEDQPRRD